MVILKACSAALTCDIHGSHASCHGALNAVHPFVDLSWDAFCSEKDHRDMNVDLQNPTGK